MRVTGSITQFDGRSLGAIHTRARFCHGLLFDDDGASTSQTLLELPLAAAARLSRDHQVEAWNEGDAPQTSLKKPSSRSAWERRRGELMSQLKSNVFSWFPTGKIPFETKVSKNSGGWHIRYGYADYKECFFQSETGVHVRAQLLTPKTNSAGAPPLIYLKRPTDSIHSSDIDELLPVLGRYTVLMLNPRFTEVPMTPSDYADAERTAVWAGRTIAAMQVWDTLRAIDWAAKEQDVSMSSISIYGKGEMGTVALYAGLFDERVQQVILSDPPRSHWQGPALLNVLRVTDLPEVAGAFAPRRLVSLTKFPESFEHARSCYRLQRASDRLVESASLPEALEIWNYPGGDRAR
jgi:hypothetical protein